LVGVLIAFEVLLIGFFFPGKIRGEIFTEDFMKTHFGDEHKTATGSEIQKGGYPDMGNGRYSAKLSYEQWYRFNNAQRAHYNFLEFAPSGLVMHFVGGIYFPIPMAVIGVVAIIGRLIYSIGYVNNGPKGRLVGAIIGDLILLGQLGLSLASAIMFIQGKEAL
jgi:glutathione S-transferase